MINIKICDDERSIEQIDAHWINQQINQRRREGQSVCVRVHIQENGVDLLLSTPTCANSGSSVGRPPNYQETEIINLWNLRGLNQIDFSGGNLIAFLEQFRHKF